MIRWKERPEIFIIEAEEGGRTDVGTEKRNGSGADDSRSTVSSASLCPYCHVETDYFFNALLFPIRK